MGLVRENLLSRTECVLDHEVCHGRLLKFSGASYDILLQRTHSQLNLGFSESYLVSRIGLVASFAEGRAEDGYCPYGSW